MNLTITYATSPRGGQPVPICTHSKATPCAHYVEIRVRAFRGRCANLGATSGACMIAPMKPAGR